MRANSVRQLGLCVAISLFTGFGINACSDDSSGSGNAEDNKCTQEKIDECTNLNKVCEAGECVKNNQELCTPEKINECALTDRDCENGECIPKADPCTQQKIDECTGLGKICENGECADKAVLSVTPTNEIPLVAYNLSMNEEDALTPASYQFCYTLDTAPTGDVTLSFEKTGTSSEYVGIEPATLTLNAENYNGTDNCITVTDLNDGTPDKTQVDDVIQITATTASSQSKFAGLTANSSVKLKDTYAYEIQVDQTNLELNEELSPEFDIKVRLMATPDEGTRVDMHPEVSCGTIVTIESKGAYKPNTDDGINNIYIHDGDDIPNKDQVLWSNFKAFRFKLQDNDTINTDTENCKITFTVHTEEGHNPDPHFQDKSVDVSLTINEGEH